MWLGDCLLRTPENTVPRGVLGAVGASPSLPSSVALCPPLIHCSLCEMKRLMHCIRPPPYPGTPSHCRTSPCAAQMREIFAGPCLGAASRNHGLLASGCAPGGCGSLSPTPRAALLTPAPSKGTQVSNSHQAVLRSPSCADSGWAG